MEKKPSKYKIQKEEIPEFDLSPEVERLQKQLDKDPNSKVFLPLAEEYRRSKMPEEAIFILEEGIKKNPAYTAAKIALARAYLEINELMKAKQVIDEILIKMPHNPLALKLHGDICFREGDFLEARKAYEQVKKLNPMDTEVDSKLSELQVSTAASKIEVASMAEHDHEMEIERSYIEHKTPPMQGEEGSNPADNMEYQGEQGTDFSVPPPPIPDQFMSTDQPAQYGNIPAAPPVNQPYDPNYGAVQEPISQSYENVNYQAAQTPEGYPVDAGYAFQSAQQLTDQQDQFQVNDFQQPQNQVNYSQNPDQQNIAEMPGVPLVSHEVVVPERTEMQKDAFHYQEQQADGYDIQAQDNFETMNEFNPPVAQQYVNDTNSGGFYTGPPTDPYYDSGMQDMQNVPPIPMPQNYQDQQGYEQPQSFDPDTGIQLQPEEFVNYQLQDNPQPEMMIPEIPVENYQMDMPDLAENAIAEPSVPMARPDEEFNLNDLESEVSIPMPPTLGMNADEGRQSIMPKEENVSIDAEERITIDSLEIDDLGMEIQTTDSQGQKTPYITAKDIVKEVSEQLQPKEIQRDDIFKTPDPNAAKNESSEKYNLDLAELYTKQGHFDKALEIYKHLLAAQPDNQDIISRLIDTEKKKNLAQNADSTNASPSERIAKMEEWFRSILNEKKDSGT